MPTSRILLPTKIVISLFLGMFTACGQPSMEATLKRYNRESVPYIQAKELNTIPETIILDTRSRAEYEVSSLPRAIWVGYRKFDLNSIQQYIPDKNSAIAVYCSVGVRSENIGEKLQKAGYTDVKNLYGGIFEWKNQGYPVYTPGGQPTEKVHAYNRRWGRLLQNAQKVY